MSDTNDNTPTIVDRVREWGITADASLIGTRDGDPMWTVGSHVWHVTLNNGAARMIVREYTMGPGHGDTPTTEDVLDSLRSETSGVAGGESVEEWASDFDADTDLVSTHDLYKATVTQAAELRTWLGDDRFQAFIYNTQGL